MTGAGAVRFDGSRANKIAKNMAFSKGIDNAFKEKRVVIGADLYKQLQNIDTAQLLSMEQQYKSSVESLDSHKMALEMSINEMMMQKHEIMTERAQKNALWNQVRAEIQNSGNFGSMSAPLRDLRKKEYK